MFMARLLVILALATAPSCRGCTRVYPVQDPSVAPGDYYWRRAGKIDRSNRLTINTDGGFCHEYSFDGGMLTECGDWSFRVEHQVGLVGLSDFRPDEHDDRLNLAFDLERGGSIKRLAINTDTGLYFVHIEEDGGLAR